LSCARVQLFLTPPKHSMHELLLYGQVSAARHDQVLKILAGLAAMQPRRILQRRIIYKPEREPEEPGSHLRRGGTQNVAVKQKLQNTTPTQLYYTHLVQKLSDEDFGKGDSKASDTLCADVDFEGGEEPRWSTSFEDIPDTGDRGVSIRFTNSTDLIGGDPHTFMTTSGPNR
jgi:mediator of RNA polymerase II transcription subunit 18